MIDKVAILIPAYNPDKKLASLIDDLKKEYSLIVVVNDGSETGLDVFERLKDGGECVVLTHEKNRGKGAALKTGFRWILENRKCVAGVVTADADGQHTPRDIRKISTQLESGAKGLVLGVRAFSGNVPFRSRFGNACTRVFFYLMTGLAIRDTQTGLRGIPYGLIPSMLQISGDRYEYEMRMLAKARLHTDRPMQVDIETVYIEGNASSHFSPIRDSIRIWGALVTSRFEAK